jgi:methionine synthase II (cobalamin-independent)
MDLRTTVRELDEIITRAHRATERESALLKVLPDCGLRHRKQHQVRMMRAHVDRLRSLRRGVRTSRRPASDLN